MLKKTGLVVGMFLLFLLASCTTMPVSESGYAVFDTTHEEKAEGVRARFVYPENWTVEEEPSRSLIIRTFRHQEETVMQHLMVQVIPLEEGETQSLFGEAADFATTSREAAWFSLFKNIEGATLKGVKAATYAGNPAVLADMVIVRDNIYIHNEMLFVLHKNRILTLTCGVAGNMKDKEAVNSLFCANQGAVCQRLFESLRFID